MTIDANEVTKKERDCLVTISKLHRGEFPPRLSEIAKDMGIKAPTALNLVERLEDKSLVEKKKGMILLTGEGQETVSSLLYVHRIMETLFVTSGVPVDSACEEVEQFDYLIPVSSASKVFVSMGNPDRCPHGEPIESASGETHD